jgi:hypothetical protein
MTTPNLLRLGRACAKWRNGVLLVATLFLIGPSVQGRDPRGLVGALSGEVGTGGGPRALSLGGALNGQGRPWSSRDVPIQGAKSDEDLAAPAAVTDLRASALSDSAVVLQWTEVRSSTTAIPRYVVRFDSAHGTASTPQFIWGANADVLTGGCAAPIVGATATGGRAHACVLAGLGPTTMYRFQMVAYTGTLNTSTAVFGPLSNVDSATTMTRTGQVLVWRPKLDSDSFHLRGAWISAYPYDTFPLRGWWNYGVYQLAAFGDSGEVVARGYLWVAKP